MTTTEFIPVDHIAAARGRKKQHQAFYTPMSLVNTMLNAATNLWPSGRNLEPSAGDGRIVHALIERGHTVDAVELDPEMHATIAMYGATMVGTDFLTYNPGEVYDFIVMNPPFTRRQDQAHVQHAYSMLAPGGEIVAIMVGSSADAIYNRLLDLPGCTYAVYERLSRDAFKESGVGSIDTLLVTIRKNKAPDQPVLGFSNDATCNAALTIETDRECSDLAACLLHQVGAGYPVAFRMEFSRKVAERRGTCYGVDWAEIVEHFQSRMLAVNPPPQKERPLDRLRRLHREEKTAIPF